MFEAADNLFRGAVISILGENLVDAYMHLFTGQELWEALEAKFGVSDAGSELYIMEQFHNYRMVDDHLFTHEHVTCTSGIERDTQDTAPEETRRNHDTQDNSSSAFETRNPTRPGWNPSGRAVAMGCPRLIRSPLGLS